MTSRATLASVPLLVFIIMTIVSRVFDLLSFTLHRHNIWPMKFPPLPNLQSPLCVIVYVCVCGLHGLEVVGMQESTPNG